jgi:predicted ABC-type ATPase
LTTRFALDRARGFTKFNSGGARARDAAEFKEADHPRAKNGQFGSGGTSAAPESKSETPAAAPPSQKTPVAKAAAPAPAPASAAAASSPESGHASTTGPTVNVSAQSQAAKAYKAPTKTADEIIASIPGAKEAVDKVRAKIAAGVTTNSLVKDGGHMQENGQYTPERQAIHRQIVNDLINADVIRKYTPKDGENPTLTILGGRGGSGKSWFTKPGGIIDTDKSFVIDSDVVKSKLPEYEGWNAALLHEESSHIVSMIDKRASKAGMNVTLDGTLKSAAILDRVNEYHDQAPEGMKYDMVGRYMYASPQVAAERAFNRFAKGGKFNGRFVPPEVVLGNTKNEQNFDKLSQSFKEWSIYNNDGDSPKLLEEHKHEPRK